MTALFTPRRIAQHLLVLLVVLSLARLGVWQLQRLADVRDRNAAQTTRFEEEPAPVGELLDGLTLADTDRLATLEFRPVTASGTFRTDDEVLQRGRSNNGRSGYDVLTPLDLDDGGTVLVRRGWVPFDNDLRPPVAEAAPPTGDVVVGGFLARSIPQPTGPLAQPDPPEGRLDVVFHADLDRLAGQLAPTPSVVLPMVVHLEVQTPEQSGALPVVQPRPSQDEGTHLSYALQWFAFALTAAGFYAVWLRRSLRGDASLASAPAADT